MLRASALLIKFLKAKPKINTAEKKAVQSI